MSDVDVLIVGGGVAGLSAAYYLRNESCTVRLLESRQPGHAGSSSSGVSRMYREMYSDPYYCARAREANALWSQLEAEHGVEIRRQHGLLFYGESWEEETIEGSIPGAKRVMDTEGIPYEALDAQGIGSRWPITPRSDFVGLFEPTAGAILAGKVLALFKDEARAAGVEILEGCGAREINGDEERVAVTDQAGTVHRARKVILAAGPWTPRFLARLGTPVSVEIWGMLWAHYAVDREIWDSYPQWFCFTRGDDARGDGGLYYGFPALESSPAEPFIKVGLDWAPAELRVPSIEHLPRNAPPQLLEHLDLFMKDGLRGVGPRLDAHLSPYTMTKDVGFVLDRVPGHEGRILTFTGGSGQAFKFAPLLGTLLADLTMDRPPRTDIAPWSITRAAVRA